MSESDWIVLRLLRQIVKGWAAGYREIPEEDYVVLSKYLSVL